MKRYILVIALISCAPFLGCDDDPVSNNGVVEDTGIKDTGIKDTGIEDTGTGTSDVGIPDTGNDVGTDTNDAGGEIEPVIKVDRFDTASQMLLANEMNESGEPFAEALGYDLDLLDPAKPGLPDDRAYVLGIENYEYSRYQLGNVVRNSGIGLHLMWGPLIRNAAAANGVSERDQIMGMMGMFGTLSNETPPGNAWPQFAEFVSGDPHLPGAVDSEKFSWEDVITMRWDRSKMTKSLQPAAMGQSLQKQYLWAQDMLGSFHDKDDNGIDADGTNSPDLPNSPNFDPANNIYYGGDTRDGFIGMALTGQGINKVAFLVNALAYDGTDFGPVDLPNYDPANGIQYLPHSVGVTEEMVGPGLPPRMATKTVDDPSSQLFDQASVLWGTASFADMMNPDAADAGHFAYKEVFDGQPFPPAASQNNGTPGPFDLMRGTSRFIFMNLKAMHYDSTAKVYVDVANLVNGAPTRGDKVSAVASAYLLVALEALTGDAFGATPLKMGATGAIREQADFIIANLSDGSGTYSDDATIGVGPGATKSLVSQSAAIRALYVAFRVTADQKYKTAGDAAYEVLIRDYYIANDKLFLTTIGDKVAVYTPFNFAILAGALREATLEGGHMEASNVYTEFFMKVGNKMQLSEGGVTGEMGNDSDADGIPFVPESGGLPPIFASEAAFTTSNE